MSEQECTDPVGGAEDRDDGPGIVDKGPCHQREKIEPQCPGAEEHLRCITRRPGKSQ